MRKFEPLPDVHPLIGRPCIACDIPFKAGDRTTLIVYGPGADPAAQDRARAGRPYAAVAGAAHWTCATGAPDDEPDEPAARVCRARRGKRHVMGHG